MLDSPTVDRIFTRLLVAYAGRWLMMTNGVPEALHKAEWAEVLADVPRWRIDQALTDLDDSPNPPTPRQFKTWCMRTPDRPKAQPVIEDKRKRDPGRLAAELQRLHALLSRRKPDDTWDELRRRKKAGESLTPAQLQMLRDATAARAPAGDAVSMHMTPIPHEHLPPAMRAEIKPPRTRKGLL